MKFTLLIILSIILIAVFLLLDSPLKIESAKRETQNETLPNYDIRTDENAKQQIAEFIAESGKTGIETDKNRVRTSEESLRSAISNLKIEYNEDLRIPEVISPDFISGTNFLTAPSSERRAVILREFIAQNRELFGVNQAQINQLEKTADYTNPDGVLSFAHFEQKIDSVPVFRGEIKAGFTKKNEIVRVINNLAPNLDYSAVSKNFGSPEQAVFNAARHLGLQTNEPDTVQIKSESNNLKITFGRGQFEDKTTAEKIYFPLDHGVVRTAWRVLFWTKNEAFYVIVDAETGMLLWRKNLTESQTQSFTYNVYGSLTSMTKTADSPAPSTPTCLNPNSCPQPPIIARQNFTFIGNEPPYNFNNLGWIPDGENRTIGNNAEAGIDRAAPNGIDPDGWAFSDANRNFIYTYNPTPGNPPPGENPLPTTQTYPPSPFQQGSVTHAFYAINRWHDEMYLLGFNEQARNFQNDNFGRGGVGNDSISVETQDSSGTNGANFTTTADGGRGRLQLFIWTGTTPNRDGALDSQVAIHEVTHGTSSRLHGNTTGLGGNMARGMGEGWSDFYALALLSETTDDVNGAYSIACYSVAGISNCYYGIRRFPIARLSAVGPNGLPHNPLTFRYINSNCNTLIGTTTTNPNSAYPRGPIGVTTCDQIHNMGEVWSVALWEVRGFLIGSHGAAEGNRRSLQYITDGMKLAPINPTLLQERDAILTATQASAPNDVCAVWRGFAVRGMGFSASIQNVGTGANNTAVTEAFDLPSQCRPTKVRADFDGDGKTDISVFRPSEGIWYLNRSTAGFAAANWGVSTDKIVPADFDGDSKTDLAVFRSSEDSNWYILNSATNTVRIERWGTISNGFSFDVPVPADYDGDGKADLAVWELSDIINEPARFLIRRSSNNSPLSVQWGSHGDTPAPADYDGDGKTDLAIYRGGTWWILNSNNASVRVEQFGLSQDKVTPADYDGDGRTDLAVFRPSDRTWYVRGSTSATIYLQFGLTDDIPVPGDYDGNGKDDIAVYRNGTWYINFIGNATNFVQISQFGLGNDIPIPNGYLP